MKTHDSAARRGISLMEVLISAFIMAVGLLGVASLLPVGHHEANSGTIADRSSLIARQAFREFHIRGYVPGEGNPSNPLLQAPQNTDADGNYVRYRSTDDPRFTWFVVASREPYDPTKLSSIERTALMDMSDQQLEMEGNIVLNYVPPEKPHDGGRVDIAADHSMMRVIVFVFFMEVNDPAQGKPLFTPDDPGACPSINRPVAVFEKTMRVEGESLWKWE